jgi:hypothetical protein
MGKKRFEVHFECDAVIELDDAVIDAVDDGWRSDLYKFYTAEEIADHIARNMIIDGTPLSHLEGWADQPDDNAKIISEDWC